MTGNYSRTTDLKFLHADFSVLKSGELLHLLAIYAHERPDIHSNELVRQLYTEPIDQNFVSMLKKP
jgi:hypothetical protein